MIEIINRSDIERRNQRLESLSSRQVSFDFELMKQVAVILEDVRRRGDTALIDYTKQFDGIQLRPEQFRITKQQITDSAERVDPRVLVALRQAIANVRAFHQRQVEHSWEMRPAAGIMLGQRVKPIDDVGIYIPGGTAAYPSSVLMNVIPAQIAGVKRIAVVTPPHNGANNSAVMAALMELNVDEVYSVGGAQAIGALAFGTETIRPVDKITGPGNRFVAAAKKLVFGVVGIDSIAGPTEVVIIADDTAPPRYVAADLLAQAEHGEDSAAVLITTSQTFAEAVAKEIQEQMRLLDRQQIIQSAFRNYGFIVVIGHLDDACELVNRLAPEHVQLITSAPDLQAQKIRNAGAIFLGTNTPAAVGDYFAGPNHVLPTARAARFSSALGVSDFTKRTNVMRYSEEAMRAAIDSIATLARVEGLHAHAQSVLLRSGEVT